MLSVAGVTKRYGERVALEDVSLEIRPGEILGLLGANGAGKTTLISIVAGLRRPDAGSVRVDGLDVFANQLAVRRMMGIAPQELGVYLQLSVRRNLTYFGRLTGLSRRQLAERVEQVADALGLVPLFDRRARELSGGEQRRLHTAMAMVQRSPLLLLDEPTAGVDVTTRKRLLEVIQALAREGVAVCYTTHYMQEVEALDASVAIIERGRLIARGTVAGLIAQAGGTLVELRVDGVGGEQERAVRVRDGDPAVALTRALALAGDDARRIRSVDVVQPSLESVFLELTGRHFNAGAGPGSSE